MRRSLVSTLPLATGPINSPQSSFLRPRAMGWGDRRLALHRGRRALPARSAIQNTETKDRVKACGVGLRLSARCAAIRHTRGPRTGKKGPSASHQCARLAPTRVPPRGREVASRPATMRPPIAQYTPDARCLSTAAPRARCTRTSSAGRGNRGHRERAAQPRDLSRLRSTSASASACPISAS